MSPARPLVGITTSYDDRRQAVHSLRQEYVRAVDAAGGLPVVLAPLLDAAEAPALLARLDALVLSGGGDVDPALFGQAPHPKLGRVLRERDDFELALCRAALARDLPILAICRGHQVLNVATGGTLIQDIPSLVARGGDHDPRCERWERAHAVAVTPGSRLHAILGTERVDVNSFHHQAIDAVGAGLRVSARAPEDGIIEGVEMPGQRFVVGVQWHPESFWDRDPAQLALFRAVVQAAAR